MAGAKPAWICVNVCAGGIGIVGKKSMHKQPIYKGQRDRFICAPVFFDSLVSEISYCRDSYDSVPIMSGGLSVYS